MKVISDEKNILKDINFHVPKAKSNKIDESDWWWHIVKGPVHPAKRNINHMK